MAAIRPVVRFSEPREDALGEICTHQRSVFDPFTERVIDYVGGSTGLAAGIIRAIGDPSMHAFAKIVCAGCVGYVWLHDSDLPLHQRLLRNPETRPTIR
jgi:hypothetical protein